MEHAVRWLRIAYWTGAVVDSAAALQMLHAGLFAWMMRPAQFEPGSAWRFAMGMAASLMLGWTGLLVWADRRPLERKGVLPLTVIPVVAGLALNQLAAVRDGFVGLASVAPIWALQIALCALFLGSYRAARRAERTTLPGGHVADDAVGFVRRREPACPRRLGSTSSRTGATARHLAPATGLGGGTMRELGLGYCGLDCERCPVFVATAKNDDALRRETAEQWSKLYGEYLAGHLGRREFKPEEMNCSGCRSANLFVGCSICAIRACARERGLTSCAHCSEYQACEALNGFYSVHPDARAALDEIRAASQLRA